MASNQIEFPCFSLESSGTIDGFVLRDSNYTGVTVYETSGASIRNCTIELNNSDVGGGGIYVWESSVEIENCVIRKNGASRSGGGIFVRSPSTVSMTDCVIEDNEGFESGGGIFSSGSNLILTRCLIRNNEATSSGLQESYGSGGGMWFGGGGAGYLLIDNCMFYGNKASRHRQAVAGGASFMMDGTTIVGAFKDDILLPSIGEITNSILWGHNAALRIVNSASLTLTHSCVQGGWLGEGNIADDPLFRDPANGDFRLQYESPCIDAGAMEGPPDDLDGKPRPLDIPDKGREGDDAFDMGAFEFQQNEIPILPIPTIQNERSDINQSGKVDVEDLLLLLKDWRSVSGASG